MSWPDQADEFLFTGEGDGRTRLAKCRGSANTRRGLWAIHHIAKPRIREHVLSPWRENITELARRQNVHCKISGMVTEADLRPYFDVVLSAFGPKRLMFGSDWPVILVASEYQRWVQTVPRAVSTLSPSEQDRIMGGTAIEVYKLETSGAQATARMDHLDS